MAPTNMRGARTMGRRATTAMRSSWLMSSVARVKMEGAPKVSKEGKSKESTWEKRPARRSRAKPMEIFAAMSPATVIKITDRAARPIMATPLFRIKGTFPRKTPASTMWLISRGK